MDWQQHYLDKHTPWDKGAPSPPLIEWLEANPGMIGGRILVPGCGYGFDCRALAKIDSLEKIIGLDISPEAVRQAGEFPQAGIESYFTGDLFDLPSSHEGAYDWVWEHTCFCAIDPALRDDYVKSMHEVLKPGGSLLAVFYLNPYDNEHERGGGPPHGTSLEELNTRFVESGRFEEIESYVPRQSYPGREELEQVIRYRRLD